MMDWKTFVANIMASIGGVLGATLIVMRFIKKRIEVYIDTAIKLRFDKKIEEYKQELKKQYSYFENYSQRARDCIDTLIACLDTSEKHISECQKGIQKCLDENLALDYIFSQAPMRQSMEELKDAREKLSQAVISFHTFLSSTIVEESGEIEQLLDEYHSKITNELTSLATDTHICEAILGLGNTIGKRVRLLSSLIRRELLAQSGE